MERKGFEEMWSLGALQSFTESYRNQLMKQNFSDNISSQNVQPVTFLPFIYSSTKHAKQTRELRKDSTCTSVSSALSSECMCTHLLSLSKKAVTVWLKAFCWHLCEFGCMNVIFITQSQYFQWFKEWKGNFFKALKKANKIFSTTIRKCFSFFLLTALLWVESMVPTRQVQ